MCQDHNVHKFPTLQVFRPGIPHGEDFQAGVRADLYSLEQWVHTGVDAAEREPRQVDAIAGCVAFRRTRACDPHGERGIEANYACVLAVGRFCLEGAIIG